MLLSRRASQVDEYLSGIVLMYSVQLLNFHRSVYNQSTYHGGLLFTTRLD